LDFVNLYNFTSLLLYLGSSILKKHVSAFGRALSGYYAAYVAGLIMNLI